MSEISDKDWKLIGQVRDRVVDYLTPYYDTDFNILRWLQGHNYDVDIAAQKLTHHLRFRKAMGLDEILDKGDTQHPLVKKYYPWGLIGPTGKENNALLHIETMGRLDGSGIVRCLPLTEILRSRLIDVERQLLAINEQEKLTKRQSGLLFIMDLEGFEQQKDALLLGSRYFKTLTEFFMEHYIGIQQSVLVVNLSPTLVYLWKLIKPFLPDIAKGKVHVLGRDWKTKVLEFVDPKCLPVHWGGDLVDENNDPMFRVKVRVPEGRIPTTYYYNLKTCPCPYEEDPLELRITAGTAELVTVSVPRPGMKISIWLLADSDFGFGVFYAHNRDGEEIALEELDQLEMVYPTYVHLSGPTFVPFNEEIVCSKAGNYVLWLNNQFAWLYSVKIKYAITVT